MGDEFWHQALAKADREADDLGDKLAAAEKALTEEKADCRRLAVVAAARLAALDAERAAHAETRAKREEWEKAFSDQCDEVLTEGERRARAEIALDTERAAHAATKLGLAKLREALMGARAELQHAEVLLHEDHDVRPAIERLDAALADTEWS